MKIIKIILLINIAMLSLTFTAGCRRNTGAVWDDTKTAGRHMNRGFRSLGGKHGSSRQISSKDEFYSDDPQNGFANNSSANYSSANSDYVPLSDDPNNQDLAMRDSTPQPRETPGDPGSSIPGIDSFQDPSNNSKLSGIFRNVYFDYNSSLVKGRDSLQAVKNVADYMQQNPNTYIFVEGHCDERGPAAFNLALGSNRSNTIRNLLINEGVSPDNIFTISYGKERPVSLGHDETSWGQNRRAEFKVYQR